MGRMGRRVMGGRRGGLMGALAVIPLLVPLLLVGMLVLALGGTGGGTASVAYAGRQEEAQTAAAAVKECVDQVAAATPDTSGAPAETAGTPPATVDAAIVGAQGVELDADQIKVAQQITQETATQKATPRATASALLAGLVASELKLTDGDLFGIGDSPSVKTATTRYLDALRRTGKVGNQGVAIADLTAQAAGGGLDASALKPFSQWAINLSGYLLTGQSAVVVSGGTVQCATNIAGGAGPGGPTAGWDPGNIASDKVFYNGTAMSETQIREWIATLGAACADAECLPKLLRDVDDQPADTYCKAVKGGAGLDAAAMIFRVSVACGVNPQVMLTTLEKESSGVTAGSRQIENWDAAWGWFCPDTGAGGSANCDPAHAGFFNQAYGMAKQWRRYAVDEGKYNYRNGQTVDILWNIEESGCGGAPVTIKSKATAALYNYTPYQPNAASLAAYPGEGDACSAYGNRNFFLMFQKWFGSTGGGQTVGGGPVEVGGKGVSVVLPAGSPVKGTVKAPNENAAKAIRTALSQLGLPYVWAGGDANGPTTGAGETGEIGFDCSGLMIYAYAQIGVELVHYSGAQAQSGPQKPFTQAKPGDLLFWGQSNIHHVAMYLGVFNGAPYMVEAAQRGTPVRVSPVRVTKSDWNGVAVTPAGRA